MKYITFPLAGDLYMLAIAGCKPKGRVCPFEEYVPQMGKTEACDGVLWRHSSGMQCAANDASETDASYCSFLNALYNSTAIASCTF